MQIVRSYLHNRQDIIIVCVSVCARQLTKIGATDVEGKGKTSVKEGLDTERWQERDREGAQHTERTVL